MSDVVIARAFEAVIRGFIRCISQVILGMCFGAGVAIILKWFVL